MDWKQQAFELYYGKHMKISDISARTGVSRQHISKYLQGFTLFKTEKEYRKKQNRIKRHEAKKQWDRQHRSRPDDEADKDCLRRQHEEAVRVLSYEKY